MSTYLKKLIRPAAFIVILLLLLQGLSYVFITRGSGNRNALAVMKQPENSIDYLFIGDSESYSSFSPMEIWMKHGFAGYNCGVAGQQAQYTYYLLNDVMQKQSPQVVILETNELFRRSGGSTELESAVENLAAKHFPLLQYHNGWKMINFREIRSFRPFEKTSAESDVMKGFHYRPQIQPYTDGEYMKKTDEVEEIKPLIMFYLKKMMYLCQEKGAELILVSVPSPDNWNYRKHNGVQQFADEYGVKYMDLNLSVDELGIDWMKDTTDKGDHLSFTGARKVTDYMGDYLAANFSLKDRRTEPKYRVWNAGIKNYLKRTDQREREALELKKPYVNSESSSARQETAVQSVR